MNYKKDIPRVSNIVSFIYPFKGEDKIRYQKWLLDNGIDEKEYLDGANELGTYIHKQMENYINGKEVDTTSPFYKEVDKIVEHGINYLKTLKGYKMLSEVYIKDDKDRYQGTADLILEKDGEIIICDFKSYGVVKRRYGKDNKFNIDKKKREKVQLQLSLYAWAMLHPKKDYRCSKVKIIYLHDEGVKEYDMELIKREEIEQILNKYYIYTHPEKDNFNININDMEIGLHIPSEQYGFIDLKIDLSKIDNGKTSQENIDDMFKVAKYMKGEYIKNLIK